MSMGDETTHVLESTANMTFCNTVSQFYVVLFSLEVTASLRKQSGGPENGLMKFPLFDGLLSLYSNSISFF